MLLCFCLALALFLIAGVATLRNPSPGWPYTSACVAWGFVFLTIALGWTALKAAL